MAGNAADIWQRWVDLQTAQNAERHALLKDHLIVWRGRKAELQADCEKAVGHNFKAAAFGVGSVPQCTYCGAHRDPRKNP